METKKSKSILRCALESLHYFIVVDETGVIKYLNKNYGDLLGISQKHAIGKHIKEIIPNTKLDKTLETGKEEIGSLITIHNSVTNNDITLVCNRIPIKEDGKIIGALAETTFQDIDEIKKLSNEIELLKNKNECYKNQLNELRDIKFSLDNIVGNSKPMIKLKELISKISNSNFSVLITGETGTGKEVFANAVHQLSNRKLNNFVKINCAAIPKDLLESELFGYSEGAFSGASKGGKMGKFELANNGTILLDEIGEMPLLLQSKLLRVLQEKELERVGGLKTIKLNVRVICNTNKNIEELVANGQFRADLYYRINVVELPIPALRERLDDMPLLCDHFIDKINKDHNCSITGISEDAISLLKKYNWPGNVRELEHVLERASVMSLSGILGLEHFDFLLPRIFKNEDTSSLLADSLKEQKIQAEKEAIIKALLKANGNKTQAAKLLEIDRSILYSKMKKYNIIY